jgi:hypothetical protein
MSDKLLFTEKEWDAAMPGVVKAMTEYLRPYRTPIYKHYDTYGDGWGSGSYLRLGDKVFILTNEHVAAAREQGTVLTNQFDGQEDIRQIVGDHAAYPAPLDLALLPVDMAAWSESTNTSNAIEIEQISLAHDPVRGELLTLAGFAGQNVTFYFNTLFAQSTCYTAREIVLPADNRFSSRFHFGLDYRPDLAATVIGDTGLPLPPGLSGSTVWNTNFVVAKICEIEWTPELAKVTGVVWGWPSGYACLVATRAEYLRSFLLGAPCGLKGAKNE